MLIKDDISQLRRYFSTTHVEQGIVGPLMCHLLEELPTPVVVVFFFLFAVRHICSAPVYQGWCWCHKRRLARTFLRPGWGWEGAEEPASSLSLTLRAFLRFSVCPCLATCVSVCVCVSLPVSSLAASCLFLMCIFTDADFYFFAGCDISFSSSSVNRAALNVAP